jgi:hypothetical protein
MDACSRNRQFTFAFTRPRTERAIIWLIALPHSSSIVILSALPVPVWVRQQWKSLVAPAAASWPRLYGLYGRHKVLDAGSSGNKQSPINHCLFLLFVSSIASFGISSPLIRLGQVACATRNQSCQTSDCRLLYLRR